MPLKHSRLLRQETHGENSRDVRAERAQLGFEPLMTDRIDRNKGVKSALDSFNPEWGTPEWPEWGTLLHYEAMQDKRSHFNSLVS